MGIVSVRSAGAYSTTLYVMVDIVKGGGSAPPPPYQAGLIFPSWWNVRQKVTIASLVYKYNALGFNGTYIFSS